MSTYLKYRERERQRKREIRRQASEVQRTKGRERSRARDKKKKKRRYFLVGRTSWKCCSGGDKRGKGNGLQCENEWQWKRGELEHGRHFLRKTCNLWKFHIVVVQNNGKEMHKTSVLRVQSCFFCQLDLLLFFNVLRRCFRRLALHDFIFCLHKL